MRVGSKTRGGLDEIQPAASWPCPMSPYHADVRGKGRTVLFTRREELIFQFGQPLTTPFWPPKPP